MMYTVKKHALDLGTKGHLLHILCMFYCFASNTTYNKEVLLYINTIFSIICHTSIN